MYKVLLEGTVILIPVATVNGPYNMAFTLLDIVTLEAIILGVANEPYMVNEPGSITRVLPTPPIANSIDPLLIGIATFDVPLTISLVLAKTPVNCRPLPM